MQWGSHLFEKVCHQRSGEWGCSQKEKGVQEQVYWLMETNPMRGKSIMQERGVYLQEKSPREGERGCDSEFRGRVDFSQEQGHFLLQQQMKPREWVLIQEAAEMPREKEEKVPVCFYFTQSIESRSSVRRKRGKGEIKNVLLKCTLHLMLITLI